MNDKTTNDKTMNDKTRRYQGTRRAGALAVAAAIAALATACSSSATPSPSASAPTYAQELALAGCMRSHGVAAFPDPGPSGGYSLSAGGSITGADGAAININSSQAQAAYGDCRHLVPGGPSISRLEQLEQQGQQQQAEALPQLLKYSECMRSHGVPSFPDLGGAQSPAPAKISAIDPSSPAFQSASTACQDLLPAGAHLSLHSSTSSSAS